jgi:protein-tyrosine phosphatase
MRRLSSGLGVLLLLSSLASGSCGSDSETDAQGGGTGGTHVGGSSTVGGGQGETGGSGGDAGHAVAGGAAGQGGGAGEVTGGTGGQATGGSAGDLTGGAGGQAGESGGPVELSGVTNARQTGGLMTSDGQRVRDNVLIRAGHLGDLDSTGCAQFEALGIHTVIDLREATDAAQTPDAECVTSTTVYYNADLPKLLPPSEQVYLDTLDATEPVLAEIFSYLSAADGLPAIIHCVIGRDRASLIVALVLLALGVPLDQVVADFENNQDASIDVDPAWLSGVLQRIEQADGIEAYLALHGVTSEQLTDLRAMALE